MYSLRPEKQTSSFPSKPNPSKGFEDISKNLFLREFESSMTTEYQDRPLPIPRERMTGTNEYFSFENGHSRSDEPSIMEKTVKANETKKQMISKVLRERQADKENLETFKKDSVSLKYPNADQQYSNSDSNKNNNIEIIMDYLNTIKLLKAQVEGLETKQTDFIDNIKTLSEANMRLRKENKDLKQRVNELENISPVMQSDEAIIKGLKENQHLMSLQKDKLIEELGMQIMNLKKDKMCLEEVVDELLQEKSDLEGHLSTLRKPEKNRVKTKADLTRLQKNVAK